jgi:putative PIN family toxin of toxin-antitoxin system
MKPRAVFDCMVFLQGAGRPASPSRGCFRLVDEGRVELCLSGKILAEVREVLSRPKTQRKFPLLSQAWAESFVRNAANKSELFDEVNHVYKLERDPKDEPYLDLAIAARAQYLVSRDRDLLDLMSDQDFRQQFPGLVILDPAAFLQAMRLQEGDPPRTPNTEQIQEQPSAPQSDASDEARNDT